MLRPGGNFEQSHQARSHGVRFDVFDCGIELDSFMRKSFHAVAKFFHHHDVAARSPRGSDPRIPEQPEQPGGAPPRPGIPSNSPDDPELPCTIRSPTCLRAIQTRRFRPTDFRQETLGDVSIAPEHRNCGLGAAVIQNHCRMRREWETAGPARDQVESRRPALRAVGFLKDRRRRDVQPDEVGSWCEIRILWSRSFARATCRPAGGAQLPDVVVAVAAGDFYGITEELRHSILNEKVFFAPIGEHAAVMHQHYTLDFRDDIGCVMRNQYDSHA